MLSAQVHAGRSPCVEVSSGVHASGGAVFLADGPELLEGRRAINGGLVGAGRLEDVVGAAVSSDRALKGSGGRGVEGAVALDNVVLDQGAAGPAIDGEVAVAVGGEASRVVDDPYCMLVCWNGG